MNDSSLIDKTDVERICDVLRERESRSGRAHFAEKYIEGREFNLSVIGDPPRVLPPAEIEFFDFPAGKPRIVGHAAKCDAKSFEYHHTDRRFDFPLDDDRMVRHMNELAIECWRLFDLGGYARVDFRCDAGAQPWILEINTNPCLSPDAGFAAALQRGGISYDDGIRRLLDDAFARRTTHVHTQPESQLSAS